MINIGALIASLLVVNLQTKVSWAWGYAVPTMAFGVALTLFLLGTRLYQYVPPGGSALTRIGQVSPLLHPNVIRELFVMNGTMHRHTSPVSCIYLVSSEAWP